MATHLVEISWFIVFILVMLIAFIGSSIIIVAILRDKSMHTSTYFYIINVNIADILLLLTCLPERITAILESNGGFNLGVCTCYLIPFLQQVSMHAALGFLLILTVHRCYPAGVPRCLQRNLIRAQIRNYSRTLCTIWMFAVVINLPLFAITKYNSNNNSTLSTNDTFHGNQTVALASCDTEATEIWSRTYLILLLVLTYLITGVFLIIIYGQVIRIILSSKKYAENNNPSQRSIDENHYFLLQAQNLSSKSRKINLHAIPSASSTNSSNRPAPNSSRHTLPLPSITPKTKATRTKNSHSAQHIQVIVMVFIVILLYILLLLPYRLLNLLFIVYNQLFQYGFMNETLFNWLLNTVRLLVFLNCALQPIVYLTISSRLRQSVIKLFHVCRKKHPCRCQCIVPVKEEEYNDIDHHIIQAYTANRYPYRYTPKVVFRDNKIPVNCHPLTGQIHLSFSPNPVVQIPSSQRIHQNVIQKKSPLCK